MSTHRVRITYGTPDRPVVRYLRWREGRKTYDADTERGDRFTLEKARELAVKFNGEVVT